MGAVDAHELAVGGTYRWFLGRGVPLRDEDGRIVRWVGTCTDVDDQKRLESERAKVLAQSEANNRMKDEFLATVSHELRTPLTAILGWARMLRLRPELAPKAIEVIERNSEAQAKLIEEVLDTSRIVSGKVQLRTQKMDLNGLVQAAVDTVRPTADARRVSLDVRLEEGLAQISIDPDRMQQVVLNLLVNAVKFTHQRGRVSVRTFAGAGEVGFSVSDTGKASHRASCRSCSSPSGRRTRRSRGVTVAWGSDWRS